MKQFYAQYTSIRKATLKVISLYCIIMICVSFMSCANTRPWTKTEKGAAAVFVVSMIADGLSTKRMLKNQNNHETNFLLGEYPTDKEVGIYFGSTSLLILLGLDQFVYDKNWRTGILIGLTGIEFGAAYHNSTLY